MKYASKRLRRSKHPSDAWRAGARQPADPESLGARRQRGGANQGGRADGCEKQVGSHSDLHLVFAGDGRRSRPAVPAKPERDAKADQQYGAEQEEDDGLLQPGYRGNRKAHRKAEEGDLQRKKTDAREERAERQQYEEDKAGCRGREQLLDARYQHDVHRDQDGNPVQRLSPDQPPPRLFAIDLRPLVDDADDTDGKRQKLPVSNERLVRSVGIGDACDGEHQRNNVGKLLPEKKNHPRMRRVKFRAVVAFGVILAHGSPTYDCPLLDVLSPR